MSNNGHLSNLHGSLEKITMYETQLNAINSSMYILNEYIDTIANLISKIKSEINSVVGPVLKVLNTYNGRITQYLDKLDEIIENITNGPCAPSYISNIIFQAISAVKHEMEVIITLVEKHVRALQTDVHQFAVNTTKMAAYGIVSVFSLFISIIMISLLVVIICWNKYRIVSFSCVIAFYVLVGLSAGLLAKKYTEKASRVFENTLHQFDQDKRRI